MTAPTLLPPLALLAELTHRCPLACPYCSNPLTLTRRSDELDTATWQRVMSEATNIGVLQVHLSGGEPTARRDLPEIVAHAAASGLYTNLITSGVLLDEPALKRLVDSGLDHVQLSVQDSEADSADRIAGYASGHRKKLAVAALVRAAGLPLTLNAVVHRGNLDNLERLIALAVELGAERLEVAHAQYYGWALRNRDALLPTREQLDAATRTVVAARERLAGILVIDYVVPDYHGKRPKACMGGWGRLFLCVSPAGKVLPCHAAETIPDLRFDNVADRSLAEIWQRSEAFQRFRGTVWMPEPCRSCERSTVDWGGCRCQAHALVGDAAATDPVCDLSPWHDRLTALANVVPAPAEFRYRGTATETPAG